MTTADERVERVGCMVRRSEMEEGLSNAPPGQTVETCHSSNDGLVFANRVLKSYL